MDGDIVIIRSFQPKDLKQCQQIIHKATMSTVGASFWAAITREIYLQLVVVLTAFMFVFGGFPPMYCLSSFILSALFIFVGIYAAHYTKSITMTKDMIDISSSYMSSEYTGFWVAEAITNNSAKPTVASVRIYRDCSAFNDQFSNVDGTRVVIGTIAVVTSKSNHNNAWLRRMAVEPAWRRRGIASALLQEALIFSKNIGYSSVELVTTECHNEARKLYTNKGFQLKQLYHKQIVPNIIQILMYDYTLSFK